MAALSSAILIQGQPPLTAPEARLGQDGRSASYNAAYILTHTVKNPNQLERFVQDHPNFDFHCPDNTGFTIMEIAIHEGLFPLIEALLVRDPSLVRKGITFRGHYFSYIALAAGFDKQRTQIFLKYGADVNCTNEEGATALFVSSINKLGKITKYLLLQGAVLYQSARQQESETNPESAPLLADQLTHIEEVTKEIEDEYTHSYRDFKRLLRSENRNKETFFDRLPHVLGTEIMDFLTNAHNQRLFVERIS